MRVLSIGLLAGAIALLAAAPGSPPETSIEKVEKASVPTAAAVELAPMAVVAPAASVVSAVSFGIAAVETVSAIDTSVVRARPGFAIGRRPPATSSSIDRLNSVTAFASDSANRHLRRHSRWRFDTLAILDRADTRVSPLLL